MERRGGMLSRGKYFREGPQMWKPEKVKILGGGGKGMSRLWSLLRPSNHVVPLVWSGGIRVGTVFMLLIDRSFCSLSTAITGSMLSLVVSSEQLILRSINESPRRVPESNLFVM